MIRYLCATLILSAFASVTAAAGVEHPEGARVDSASYVCKVVGDKAVVTRYSRITIVSPPGEDYNRVSASESKFVRLNSIEIRLLDASGKVTLKKGKSDMLKACGFGRDYVLYDDNCTYFIELAAPNYPYTIEVTRESELQSLFHVRGVDIQGSIPLAKMYVQLQYPEDRPIAWKLYGLDSSPTESVDGKRHTVTWTFSDIPALKTFEYTSPGAGDGINLKFAADQFDLDGFQFNGRGWKNVGLWQRELNRARYSDSLGPRPADDSVARDTAFRIYNDVIGAIRYVMVSIGLSGWQPNPPDLVAQRRYGDCKDMSTLLVSRLRAAGIQAYPCLILTNSEGRVDTSFVTFEFNHVITMALVGHDTLWMDPTCDDCPPGELPTGDVNNTLLVVTDTGGVLVTTPLPEPDDNLVVRTCDAAIDDSGHVTLTTTARVTGNSARYLRTSLNHVGADEAKQFVGEWFLGYAKRFVLKSYAVTALNDLAAPVKLEAVFTSVGSIDRLKNTSYFRPLLLTSREIYDDAKLKERTVAVNLGYPRTTIDSVIVHGALLSRCDSTRLPDSTSLSFGGIDLMARFSTDTSGIRACMTQAWNGYEVPVEKFDSLAQFLSSRKQLLDKPIKFYLKGR